jgi:hypothetical protein
MKIYKIVFAVCFVVMMRQTLLAQEIPYGNNSEAGHYFNVGNCKFTMKFMDRERPLCCFMAVYTGILMSLDI